MIKAIHFFVCMLALTVLAPHANAQLNSQSVLSLEASRAAVAGDYNKAISIYNQLIRMSPNKASHYIQRGLLYRQVKNLNAAANDGAIALQLTNQTLARKSSRKLTAKRYWQRSQAYRLLLNYDEAIQDMRYAIELKGSQRWRPDLQALVLERKIHNPTR